MLFCSTVILHCIKAFFPNIIIIIGFQSAAVAYVADLLKIPSVFLKVVIDIKDGEKTTLEESSSQLLNVRSPRLLILLMESASQIFDAFH